MPDYSPVALQSIMRGGPVVPDFTKQYNTPIPPERVSEYLRWRAALPPQLQNSRDYDLQGAFLNGSNADWRAHLTDRFKKPNHATFSKESQYHGTDGYTGGEWTEQGFMPSQANLAFMPQDRLQQYFNREETTPLLTPAPVAPSGPRGQYTLRDLQGVAPAAPVPSQFNLMDLLRGIR